MSRLKAVGLAALAVLAISVVVSPMANAAEGTAVVSAGSTAVSASQTLKIHTFTLPGGRVFSCGTRTFTGTFANGDKEFTVAPTFHECHVTVLGSTLPATAEPAGCVYRFYDLTTSAADTYAAKTDIVCPAGQALHYKLYLTAANHAAGTRICEYTVKPQTLNGVVFKDNTNGTLNFNFVEVQLAVTRTFGTAGNCGEVNFVSKYNGDTLAIAGSGTLGLDD